MLGWLQISVEGHKSLSLYTYYTLALFFDYLFVFLAGETTQPAC